MKDEKCTRRWEPPRHRGTEKKKVKKEKIKSPSANPHTDRLVHFYPSAFCLPPSELSLWLKILSGTGTSCFLKKVTGAKGSRIW